MRVAGPLLVDRDCGAAGDGGGDDAPGAWYEELRAELKRGQSGVDLATALGSLSLPRLPRAHSPCPAPGGEKFALRKVTLVKFFDGLWLCRGCERA